MRDLKSYYDVGKNISKSYEVDEYSTSEKNVNENKIAIVSEKIIR